MFVLKRGRGLICFYSVHLKVVYDCQIFCRICMFEGYFVYMRKGKAGLLFAGVNEVGKRQNRSIQNQVFVCLSHNHFRWTATLCCSCCCFVLG